MYENLFKSPLHRVFVYGTLKRGEPNHKLIQDATKGFAKFLGIGKTVKPYPLVIATKYNIPFLLRKEHVGHQIFGELYDVDTKMLKSLDELEEHPNFYVRSEEEVYLATDADYKSKANFAEVGTLTKAWIYFLPKFRDSLLVQEHFPTYSSKGSHGLEYGESEENTATLEDLL
ncbi:putative gamma-glutamylcyclotransferase CG2811 isoform X2 [Prorops nasuta]|uniref:putative gamma-glutamylcyclotransferase CG2811 isoform X2 n=1 Tax=Prorops nasuta TaxID=863751 RepID=UPI0034CD47C3